MNRITFFTEKGGTGKTTFSVIYASYLHSTGKRVIVFDFDSPSHHCHSLRVREMSGLPDSASERLYPILEVDFTKYNTEAKRQKLVDYLKNIEREYSHCIYDFGGSMKEGDAFIHLIRNELIDCIIIPTRLDMLEMTSAVSLVSALSKINSLPGKSPIRFKVFYNGVKASEKKEKYEKLKAVINEACEGKDIFFKSYIRDTVSIRKESDPDSIRSTLVFPRNRVLKYNPEIIELFDEINKFIQ